jgi:hypothetical protein
MDELNVKIEYVLALVLIVKIKAFKKVFWKSYTIFCNIKILIDIELQKFCLKEPRLSHFSEIFVFLYRFDFFERAQFWIWMRFHSFFSSFSLLILPIKIFSNFLDSACRAQYFIKCTDYNSCRKIND